MDTVIDILALAYEAAVAPELWPNALDAISSAVGGHGAALILVDQRGRSKYIVSDPYRPILERGRHKVDQTVNLRPARALLRNHAGFLLDLDLCTEEELGVDFVYQEILRPFGITSTVGTIIPVPTGDFLVFDLLRARDAGPFDRSHVALLDRLRPHLARAALLTARLQQQQAEFAAAVLNAIGLPAAIIDAGGIVLADNDLFEGLDKQVMIGAGSKIRLADRSKNDVLQAAISCLAADNVPSVRSIPLAATEELPALICHVVPIRRSARDILQRASALIFVTPVTALTAPLTDILHGLFDLTPTEAHLARKLMNGATVEETANQLGKSRETVRTQLKSIMAKTGTTRQSDLVRLLAGTVSLPLPT